MGKNKLIFKQKAKPRAEISVSAPLSAFKSFAMNVSPVVVGDGGYSKLPCTPLLGGSALHSFGGTSHPGNSSRRSETDKEKREAEGEKLAKHSRGVLSLKLQTGCVF